MPTSTATDPPDPTRRIVVVDRPGAVQTEIRVGQLAIRRDHQDYMPLNLAVKILGGEGGNRLQGVLRSDRGLTYGASAEMDAFQRSGAIVADTDTRTETTVEALRLTVDEFIRLQQEAVTERELDSAQAFLAGNFALTIETPDAIALKVLNAIFYGLDLKDLPDYPQQVYRVTTEDIQRVSRAYLRPSRLAIVLVGDAAKFVPELKKAGFDNYELVKLDELDLDRGQSEARPASRGWRARDVAAGAMTRVFISCGEASGDLYAAALAEELRRREPGIEIVGFGGPRLAAAGATLYEDYRHYSVTGLAEVVKQLPRTWRLYRRLVAEARRHPPDVFVPIDFPGLQLPPRRVAERRRRAGGLLRRAAAVGLARGTAEHDAALRVAGPADLPVRAGDLPSEPTCPSSSSATR